MDNITVEIPKPANWCQIVTTVPPNARSGYDYQGELPESVRETVLTETAKATGQKKGGLITPGLVVPLPPGIVLLSQSEHRSLSQTVTNFQILLPNGQWYKAYECTGKSGWAYILRPSIRSWLSLSPVARILRAINEMTIALDREFSERMRGRSVDNLAEEDLSVLNQITNLERMATNVSLSPSEELTTAELTAAFHKWLEAMASTTGREPEELKLLLTKGLQQESVDEPKTLGRALRF